MLTIQSVDRTINTKGVHASRGKVTRAEPIAALSEQHRIKFVGSFPKLEDELCEWTPGAKDSPNRLDAFVWGMTELSARHVPTFLDRGALRI
jgi:phage terminase large subunit-like protein